MDSVGAGGLSRRSPLGLWWGSRGGLAGRLAASQENRKGSVLPIPGSGVNRPAQCRRLQERPLDAARLRGCVTGMHERRCETTTTHPLVRREAVEAGDVRVEVDSAGCCRRAIHARQQEQQRAIPKRTERVVNLLPILTAPVVTAEHLAVDLMPGAKLAARAHLGDLALDLRHRNRPGSSRAAAATRNGRLRSPLLQ
jgi:hypothetical protein